MEKTKKIPSKPVGKCKKKIVIAVSAAAATLITLLTLALTLGWFAPADGATKVGYKETNKRICGRLRTPRLTALLKRNSVQVREKRLR